MIKPPPDHFEGTITSFVDAYVVPNFPPAAALIAWTEALLDYHRRDDAICVVRGTSARGSRARRGGVTVVQSDNSPGRWVHLRAMDGTVKPSEIARLLDTGDIPVLYAARDDERARWTYGKRMPGRDKAAHANPRLKHCHIAAALDGAPDDPRALALRNLCPVNHFLFPSPKHFIHRRDGWTEGGRGAADLGESPRVIAVVRSRMEAHLGRAGARVLAAFDEAVGSAPRARLDDARIVIQRCSPDATAHQRGATASRGTSSPSPRPTPSGLPTHSAFGPAASAGFWAALFSYAAADDRREILLASPSARQRVAQLQANLSVEQLVGLGNAWFNKCDPRKLRALHPGSPKAQAEQALAYLEEAKGSPSLGGKWALAVDALRPSQAEGLDRVPRLGFDAFLTVLRGVESRVYRTV